MWYLDLELFFCFKQKTAYEMRISDWSSDVCSSDLEAEAFSGLRPASHFSLALRKQPKTPCAGSHVCLTAVIVTHPAPRCRPTVPILGHRHSGARQCLA